MRRVGGGQTDMKVHPIAGFAVGSYVALERAGDEVVDDAEAEAAAALTAPCGEKGFEDAR